MHGKMNKRLEASEAEKRAKEQELRIKSQTNRVKLEEAKADNNKLQEEIEAVVNGSKRSDIGLVGSTSILLISNYSFLLKFLFSRIYL